MQTFAGLPNGNWNALQKTKAVLFGAPEATPYEVGTSSHAADAPKAIRQAMAKFSEWHSHYDFDLDTVPLEALTPHCVDCGDVQGDPKTPDVNRSTIKHSTQSILNADAIPFVMGGDDSVPIPFLEAYEKYGPIWVIQIDAHIDWKHERFGERLGWSSNMRRASEMPWVAGITQLGIRGIGSALQQDVAGARAWGANIVTARRLHENGVESALSSIPIGSRCVIALDVDGLDPSVMPGVLALAPGGMTYWQMLEVVEIVKNHHSLAGFSLVEFVPRLDVNGLSALTAGRILLAALHAACAR